jgi:hypothetical protein
VSHPRTASSAIRIAESDAWIVFDEGAPKVVASELEQIERPATGDLGGTRSLSGVTEVILNLVLGGVVGNAAWAAIPETARYIQILRSRKFASVPDVDAAAERIRRAARSIHGPGVSVEIGALNRTADGAWECEVLVAERWVVARIDPAGVLVAWVEGRDNK